MFGRYTETFTRSTLQFSSTLTKPTPASIKSWKEPCCTCNLNLRAEEFAKNGFIVLDQLLQPGVAEALNDRLERVLCEEYDTGVPPEKMPGLKLRDPWKPGKRTIQIVNIRHADKLYNSVITSPVLGQLVADVANWKGARLASDQVWCKPPQSGALSFHRDSAYFDFVPSDVVTIWIAFDEMVPEVGPLEHVEGSHLWGEGRVGSANQFFDNDRRRLMFDAALKEGFTNPEEELHIHQVNVPAGGGAIHNGKTWHGSDRNRSTKQPRRGLGIHFVPACAQFKDGELGRMWGKHRIEGSNEMPDDQFPVTFRR